MIPQTWRLRRRLLAAVLAAVLLLAAFPPIDVRFLAWVALVPLFLALRGATARAGMLAGLVAGLVFFGGLLYWLVPFGFVAWGPLVVLQALTWALAGWFGAWASHRWRGRMFGIPLVFTAAEMLRARWPLGGFPWGLAGTTQHSGGPLLPLARVGGVFLLGLAVYVINAGLAELLAGGRWYARATAIIAAAGIAVGSAFLPIGLAGAASSTLDVAAIQVNVREGTFGPTRGRQLGDVGLHIVDQFAERSEELSSDPPDLVIWPENALDRDPISDPEIRRHLDQAVADVDRPFLAGAILDVDEQHFRNSLLLVMPGGEIAKRYDKQRLVPFGEYVPWPSLRAHVAALRQVPYDAVPGGSPVVFDIGGTKVGGVICFESIFPDVARSFVDDGAQILVVATNNASFGRTTAPAEHLAQSQIRAVEEGRYVVHAAISGASAIVAPAGRVSQRTGLFRDATIRARIPATSGKTPYARYGAAIENGLAGLGVLTAAGGVWGVFARRRDRREAAAVDEFDWSAGEPAVAVTPAADTGEPAAPVAPAAEETPAETPSQAPSEGEAP